jgi:hypothetical protein
VGVVITDPPFNATREANHMSTWLETAMEWAEETVEHGASAYINPQTAEAVAQTLLAMRTRLAEKQTTES